MAKFKESEWEDPVVEGEWEEPVTPPVVSKPIPKPIPKADPLDEVQKRIDARFADDPTYQGKRAAQGLPSAATISTPTDFPRVTATEQTKRDKKASRIIAAEGEDPIAEGFPPAPKGVEVIPQNLDPSEDTGRHERNIAEIDNELAGQGASDISKPKIKAILEGERAKEVSLLESSKQPKVSEWEDVINPDEWSAPVEQLENLTIFDERGRARIGPAVDIAREKIVKGGQLILPHLLRDKGIPDAEEGRLGTMFDMTLIPKAWTDYAEKKLGIDRTPGTLDKIADSATAKIFGALPPFAPVQGMFDFIADLSDKIPEEQWDAIIKEHQTGLRDLADREEALFADQPPPDLLLELVTSGITTGVPQIPFLVASYLTKSAAPSLIFNAYMEAGAEIADAQTPDKDGNITMPIRDMWKMAGTTAAISNALEGAQVGNFFKRLDKAGTWEIFWKFLGEEMVQEAGTEFGTAPARRAWVEEDRELPMGEFITNTAWRAAKAALGAPFGAGITVGGAAPIIYPLNRYRRKKAEAKFERDIAEVKEDFDRKWTLNSAGLGEQTDPSVPRHQDIPDVPLTAAETELATVQEANIISGADTVPIDPAAQAEAQTIQRAIDESSGSLQNTEESERLAQAERDAMKDRDPLISDSIVERRIRQILPNALPANQRPIAYSSDPTQIGLTLEQTKIAPNSVVLLAGNEAQFSPAYTQALGLTIKQWSKKYMPEGYKVLINLSGLTSNKLGSTKVDASTGTIIISPREIAIKKQTREDSTSPESLIPGEGITLGLEGGRGTGYNTFTQAQTLGAITHEFGHALTMAAFAARMPSQFKNIIGELDSGKRDYTEEQFALMPKEEAAVIRKYQQTVARIKSGEMKADEFVENWLGTWKTTLSIGNTVEGKSLYTYALKALAKRGMHGHLNQIKALDLVHALSQTDSVATGEFDEQGKAITRRVSQTESDQLAENYILQFNEYMAEQMSRYAHSRGIEQGTPFATYFKRALKSLKEYFKALKTTKGIDGTAMIAPDVTFAEWVDMLAKKNASRAADTAKKTKRRTAELKLQARKTVAEDATERKPKKRKPRKTKKKPDEVFVEKVVLENTKVEPALVEVTVTEEQEMAHDPFATAALRERVKQQIPDKKSVVRAEIMQLIHRGRLMDAQAMLVDVISEQARDDVKGTGGRWDAETVTIFRQGLYKYWMVEDLEHLAAGRKGADVNEVRLKTIEYMDRMILSYLKKTAGTEKDELADVLVDFHLEHQQGVVPTEPVGVRWAEVMDTLLHQLPTTAFREGDPRKATPEERTAEGKPFLEGVSKFPADKPVWSIGSYYNANGQLIRGDLTANQEDARNALNLYLERVSEYIRSHYLDNSNKPDNWKTLERTSLPQIIKAVNTRNAQVDLLYEAIVDNPSFIGTETLQENTDGTFWVTFVPTIEGRAAIRSEGVNLGFPIDKGKRKRPTCFNNYCDDIIKGDIKVLSLRKADGTPVATLGWRPARFKSQLQAQGLPLDPELFQVWGPEDGPIEGQYQPTVQEFIQSQSWSDISNEGRPAGLRNVTKYIKRTPHKTYSGEFSEMVRQELGEGQWQDSVELNSIYDKLEKAVRIRNFTYVHAHDITQAEDKKFYEELNRKRAETLAVEAFQQEQAAARVQNARDRQDDIQRAIDNTRLAAGEALGRIENEEPPQEYDELMIQRIMNQDELQEALNRGEAIIRADLPIPDAGLPGRIAAYVEPFGFLDDPEELVNVDFQGFDEENNRDPQFDDRQGNFFDEGSGDSDEVQQTLHKAGFSLADTIMYQRAVNFMKDAAHYVQQMQQIAHSSQDHGARAFVRAQNHFQASKNALLKKGVDTAERWEKKLSKDEAKKMETLLQREFREGEHLTKLVQNEKGQWVHQVTPELQAALRNEGIDPDTEQGQLITDIILSIKDSINEHIQAIENGAIDLIENQFRKAPLVVQMRAAKIRALAKEWRESPFIPQGHYGRYVMKVYGPDSAGNRQVIHQEHFTSKEKRLEKLKKYQKVVHPDDLKVFDLEESKTMQLTLPLDFLETLKDTGEFTDDDLATIGGAMTPLRGEKAFSKFERDFSKVSGAEEDMLRNYANWIEDSANFTSKWVWSRKMTQARALTRGSLISDRNSGNFEAAIESQRLLDTMTRAQELIMHPKAEWYRMRSLVALTYLMWAPKTALMNLTGMFQTFAAVTADYGDVKGNMFFGGAMKDLMMHNFNERESKVLDQALTDGVIDQGFGYFMSGLANAGNLRRRVRPTMWGKVERSFVDLGMLPFKAVEEANRRVTILTMYRAEFDRLVNKKGWSEIEAHQRAYDTAANRTRLLQNDYASGNRPPVLTGRKSIAMIFLSYPQYMLWIMSGGYERGTRQQARDRGDTPRSWFGGQTMRMWLIFLALAGPEGLPFGEFIIDILQGLWKKFGSGENIRLEAQRFMKDQLDMNPYWRGVAQRGLLHDVHGVDLSGSYSLGSPIPGLRLFFPHSNTWREYMGEVFEELSGPFGGGVVKAPLQLAFDRDNDTSLRDLGRSLPAAAGSIARAADYATEGVKTNQGARILKDDEGNFRDPTPLEIAATAGGFRLSEVARYQEIAALQRERGEYWANKRTQLKYQYYETKGDPDARKDVNEAIQQYNDEVPFHKLKLKGSEKRQYVRQRDRRIRNIERDRESRRNRRLHQDVEDVFSEGTP